MSLEWPEGEPIPEGGVEVEFTVNALGEPEDPRVLTDDLSDQAVSRILAAILQFVFEPARRGEQPIPARIRYRFEAPRAPPPATDEDAPTQAQANEAPTDGPEALLGEDTDSFGATARVRPKEPGAASKIELSGDELTVVPGTFGEPLRVVATLPGVARSPFGFGFFAVRGASFQNTGFLVDGFPVPLLYHLGAGPAILSSRLVEGLDFYAGGYPVNFGRYSAGVISLRTAPPRSESWFAEFEVDLLKASTTLVVPFDEGRGRIAVAFRRSYYELILPLITDEVQVSYLDYQVRADYELTSRLSLSLFLFGSRDYLNFSQNIGSGQTVGSTAGGLRYNFDRIMGRARYRISDQARLTWSGTFGPSSIDFGQNSTGAAGLGVDTASRRIGQRLELVLTPNERFQTTMGLEQGAWINRITGSAPSLGELPGVGAPENTRESIRVQDRISELTLAPYIEQVARPGPFTITGGLRLEHYAYGDVKAWAVEPRGVVRWAINEPVAVKVASGLFSQAPLPFQVNRSYGNPELRLNRALQNSLGTEIKLPFDLSIESTLFFNRMWNLTRGTARPELGKDGVPTLKLFDDDGEGRSYGWELLIRREAKEGLFGWLSYTLSRSERFLNGGQVLPFFFDQTHVLNFALSYKVGGFRFGARLTLATGRPTNDLTPTDSRDNVVWDADENDYDVEFGAARTRLPLFHQLDVRIDRDFVLGPLEGSFYLDIINIYNANNAESYAYEYDFSQRGTLPGLPFLPTLGVRAVLR